MDFIFIKCVFSLILFMFLSILPKLFQKQYQIILEFAFLLSAYFFVYMFKFSINWPVAVVLSTF
jgi:hypothetical protein